jgi:uncharacterized protein (DUF488 family)
MSGSVGPAPKKKRNEPISILTVGHSNRPLADFLTLLQSHAVDLLVDIRTVPKSRHNPQFNKENLPQSLADASIEYLHMPGLGGLRHPRKDSPNTAWRNLSFRGYADYMQTPDFERYLLELIELARSRRLAVMCAEAVPWRCHRSLVADALTARGISVAHIMSPTRADPHKLTSFAKVQGNSVVYPSETLDLFPSG